MSPSLLVPIPKRTIKEPRKNGKSRAMKSAVLTSSPFKNELSKTIREKEEVAASKIERAKIRARRRLNVDGADQSVKKNLKKQLFGRKTIKQAGMEKKKEVGKLTEKRIGSPETPTNKKCTSRPTQLAAIEDHVPEKRRRVEVQNPENEPVSC